jgi:RNA polymerase sigma factor (sigma-70 family)
MSEDVDRVNDSTFHRTCQQIVQMLSAKYRWTLLSENELIRWLFEAAQPEALPTALERMVKQYYTLALYSACKQAEDRDRHERAYRDLCQYLYRVAYSRWPEIAEDVVQRALLLLYEQIDRCEKPAAFLAFALYKLLHAAKQERRSRSDDLHLQALERYDALCHQPAMGAPLLQQEGVQVILDAIARLPDKRKQSAVYLKAFAGLDDETIGARLEITPGHVRVLRHRALKSLWVDHTLNDYFEYTAYSCAATTKA